MYVCMISVVKYLQIPDIDVKMPEIPKVIDLSGLGPKTSVNLTLPEVKLPHAGSLTVRNSGASEPQFLDLTGKIMSWHHQHYQ